VQGRPDRPLARWAVRASHRGAESPPALRSDDVYPAWDPSLTRLNDDGYGVDVERNVAIYHRWGDAADGRTERLIVVLNFGPDAQTVDVPFSENGAWTDLLSDAVVNVDGFWLRGTVIESNWGRVYRR
jgi:pullulanase